MKDIPQNLSRADPSLLSKLVSIQLYTNKNSQLEEMTLKFCDGLSDKKKKLTNDENESD